MILLKLLGCPTRLSPRDADLIVQTLQKLAHDAFISSATLTFEIRQMLSETEIYAKMALVVEYLNCYLGHHMNKIGVSEY